MSSPHDSWHPCMCLKMHATGPRCRSSFAARGATTMFQGFRSSAPNKKAARRHRLSDSRRKAAMAPLIEALEDRTVMSTLVWTGGNGDWDNAAKWGGTIPGANDTALINDSNITITHSTGAAD